MSPPLTRSIPEEGRRKEKRLDAKQLKKTIKNTRSRARLVNVASDIFPTLRKMPFDRVVDLSRANLISCDPDPNG